MSLPPNIANATNGPNSLGGLVQYSVRLPVISATTAITFAYAVDGDQEVSLSFVPDVTIAADASNYWTIQAQNAGTDGSGSTAMMTAVTTEAASLNGITAFDAEDVTLTAPSLSIGEVGKVVFTKAASASDLSGLLVVTLKRRITYF